MPPNETCCAMLNKFFQHIVIITKSSGSSSTVSNDFLHYIERWKGELYGITMARKLTLTSFALFSINALSLPVLALSVAHR